MKRYNRLAKLVAFNRPSRIIEIGTHKAERAVLMCKAALKRCERVHYVGYDLFEGANAETDAREMNGKGAGSLDTATAALDELQKDNAGFTYELVPGDTRVTLHGTEQRADFVFIDGGHSVGTIRGDYEAVRGSRLIVFDDYYTHAKDLTQAFGCNAIVDGLMHELMPEEDRIRDGIGVKLAVVGYSTKWAPAITRVCKKDGHKTVSLWRGRPVEPADLVCAVNVIEQAMDLDAALEDLRKLCLKRLFFVIKADALRSLDSWRTRLERCFQILEWLPGADEVVGTAMPLSLVGEWKSKGVLSDDERFENAKYSCSVTSKRVRPYQDLEGNDLEHGRRAIIVGFGPSLRDSWTGVLGEKRLCQDEADIISMSGSHDFLLRRDITPDYHVEVDPRPHKALNLTQPNNHTKYYIASCCHPHLIDKLKNYDLWLWHLLNGEESFRIAEEIDSEANSPFVGGGGSVGLRAIALFYSLGYRKFSIHGMDCSFAQASDGSPVDSKDQQVQRWAGAHKGKKKEVIKVRCGDKWFLTSPVDVTYTRHFTDTVQRSHGAEFTLFGNGLLQEMMKVANQQEKAA